MSGPQFRRSTVADVMTTVVMSVAPEASFADVAHALFTAAVRAVPVLDEAGRLLGVVSEADLLVTAERGEDRHWWQRRPRHITREAHSSRAGATTAGALMTTSVVTVGPDMTVAQAARTMREKGLSWMPVVDVEERVVGVLSRSDLLAVYLRDDAAIRREIEEQVLAHMLAVDPDRVDVAVADGVVTLTGELDTRADTELAVRFVERLEGVVSVVDWLTYAVDERLADHRIGPFY
jgi:CBS-domain-containing membrane protein